MQWKGWKIYSHLKWAYGIRVKYGCREGESREKRRGSLSLGISGELGVRGFQMNGGLTLFLIFGFPYITFYLSLAPSLLIYIPSGCPSSSVPSMITAGKYMVGKDVIWKVYFQWNSPVVCIY